MKKRPRPKGRQTTLMQTSSSTDRIHSTYSAIKQSGPEVKRPEELWGDKRWRGTGGWKDYVLWSRTRPRKKRLYSE